MVENIPEGYKKTEVGVIPEDWECVELGKIVEYVKGYAFKSKDYRKNGVRIIRISDTTFDSIKDENAVYIDSRYAYEYDNWKLIEDDIMVSTVGSKPPMYDSLVGKSILINKKYAGSLINQNAVVLRSKFKNQKLIYANLRQPNYIKYIEMIFRGNANQASITLNELFKFNFAMPKSSDEQQAIASALADIDGLISSLTKLMDKKKSIMQGEMQELLTGKTRLDGFSDEWICIRLGELCEIKDGTHQTPKYVDAGIPFYSVESISQNEFKSTKFISEEEHIRLTKSFRIEKGDILMTRIGSIGKCKYINWDVNASFYVSLALLKVKKEYSAEFICHYSETEYFKQEIEINSLQAAIPKKINLGQISNVAILIPPTIEEQTAIAQILSDMDTEIEKLNQKLNKYKQIKQGMMQELLTGKRRLI